MSLFRKTENVGRALVARGWQGLKSKTDEELLMIAKSRLAHACRRDRLVWRIASLISPRKATARRQSSIYYADAYALFAVNELINRQRDDSSDL